MKQRRPAKRKPNGKASTEARLLRLRKRMDLLDQRIARLLLTRLALSLSIIAEKSTLDRPVHDPKREREVLANLTKGLNPSGTPARLLTTVYREIFRQTVESAKTGKLRRG